MITKLVDKVSVVNEWSWQARDDMSKYLQPWRQVYYHTSMLPPLFVLVN